MLTELVPLQLVAHLDEGKSCGKTVILYENDQCNSPISGNYAKTKDTKDKVNPYPLTLNFLFIADGVIRYKKKSSIDQTSVSFLKKNINKKNYVTHLSKLQFSK